MRAIPAIWKDGRIVPTQPVDWPDGTALSVEPLASAAEAEGDLLGDDPDSIARWLAAFEALPPLQMSEAEEARWRAARQEVGGYTLARMRERSDGERP
ncbi:hypothetical protein [Tautonia plasticadhaerens]|uniref:Uncharacterized protein n=1 Tax=Tautonia plasticadhaerens TaxID=2527974 RepID=A0A518HEB5_9BACT|nr:hypothetical protein [Tautonia plasticadhaerens]QDV39194.1 hypothetical protein ElP_71580 [Tautonia plasticadhaerens]